MSQTAAVGVLAAALEGISRAHPNVDPELPDLAADIVSAPGDELVATFQLRTGDRYRITVEWLKDESP